MRNGANHSKHHKCTVTLCKLEQHVRVIKKVLRRARARHDKTEKHVRATRCSVFTPPSRARHLVTSVRETI